MWNAVSAETMATVEYVTNLTHAVVPAQNDATDVRHDGETPPKRQAEPR